MQIYQLFLEAAHSYKKVFRKYAAKFIGEQPCQSVICFAALLRSHFGMSVTLVACFSFFLAKKRLSYWCCCDMKSMLNASQGHYKMYVNHS